MLRLLKYWDKLFAKTIYFCTGILEKVSLETRIFFRTAEIWLLNKNLILKSYGIAEFQLDDEISFVFIHVKNATRIKVNGVSFIGYHQIYPFVNKGMDCVECIVYGIGREQIAFLIPLSPNSIKFQLNAPRQNKKLNPLSSYPRLSLSEGISGISLETRTVSIQRNRALTINQPYFINKFSNRQISIPSNQFHKIYENQQKKESQ